MLKLMVAMGVVLTLVAPNPLMGVLPFVGVCLKAGSSVQGMLLLVGVWGALLMVPVWLSLEHLAHVDGRYSTQWLYSPCVVIALARRY
jgi:hypothetical protein